MVPGVGHLDGAAENFQTTLLEPVLCRLRAYTPDVVLTETLPGEQVIMLDASAAYHRDAGEEAGPRLAMAEAAQAELKLSAGEALAHTLSLSIRAIV